MKSIVSDEELIEIFLDSFDSHGTRVTYRRRISYFQEFLDERRLGVTDCAADTIRKFISTRYKDLGDSSTRLQMAVLKSLFKFGVKSGYLRSNIMSEFTLPKIKPYRTFDEMAADDQIIELLDHIDAETLKGIRQRALVCLHYYGLLKISEALSLRHCDVLDTNEGYKVRICRQSKERVISILGDGVKYLKDYIDVLPSSAIGETPLFIGTKGKGSAFATDVRFNGTVANTHLVDYRRDAGVSESITFEFMRQAGLRRFIKSGGTLTDARELYGCKSIDTIEKILGNRLQTPR